MEHPKVMSQLVCKCERVHFLNPCIPKTITYTGDVCCADRVRAPKPSKQHDYIPPHITAPVLRVHRPQIVDDGRPPPARRERVLRVVAVPVHADQHQAHARCLIRLASNVGCCLYHSQGCRCVVAEQSAERVVERGD